MKTPHCDHAFQKSLRWSPFLYDRCFVFEPISRQPAFSEWTTRSFRKLVAWRCCSNSDIFDRLDKFMNFRLIAQTFSKNFVRFIRVITFSIYLFIFNCYWNNSIFRSIYVAVFFGIIFGHLVSVNFPKNWILKRKQIFSLFNVQRPSSSGKWYWPCSNGRCYEPGKELKIILTVSEFIKMKNL